jgi:hypothetical protein
VVAVVVRLLACAGRGLPEAWSCGAAVACRGALLLDPARTVTLAHESRDIRQGADMTQRIVPTANLKRLANTSESAEACSVMRDLCRVIWDALTGLVQSRAALQAEILVLRHQINVLRRKSPKRADDLVSVVVRISDLWTKLSNRCSPTAEKPLFYGCFVHFWLGQNQPFFPRM